MNFPKIITRGCVITVGTLAFFYLFALLGRMSDPLIGWKNFLLILLFSELVSFVSEIFGVEKIAFPLRLLIHYAVLLVSFSVIFISAGNVAASGKTPAVFVAFFLFTVLYAAVFLVVFLAKKTSKKQK